MDDFFESKFNEFINSKNLNAINDPNDRAVAIAFVKFVCKISTNSRPITIELSKIMMGSTKYRIIAKFPAFAQLKWSNEEKGLEKLIQVNDLVFDDCCILHKEDNLIVEIILNKTSGSHIISHFNLKMKTARKDIPIQNGADHHDFLDPKDKTIVNNFTVDVYDTSQNSESYIFNDIPLAFIKNDYDKMMVENFSRFGRIFMQGQECESMEISQGKNGMYVISIVYGPNSYFGWQALATFPVINPFLFHNMCISHSNRNLKLTILVRTHERRLFIDKESCEMILQHIKTKGHRCIPKFETEITYEENDASTESEEDELIGIGSRKPDLGSQKHVKTH